VYTYLLKWKATAHSIIVDTSVIFGIAL